MAAKGSVAKQAITDKILEVFPDAFVSDKELRIPWDEGSGEIQIKVSLVCAKTNIERRSSPNAAKTATPASDFMNEPTAEEKQRVSDLLNKLGLS